MKYTPKNFAELLYKSSLSDSEKEDIIELLPTLSQDQIDEIFITLKDDVDSQEKIWEMADEEVEVLQEKIELELKAEA